MTLFDDTTLARLRDPETPAEELSAAWQQVDRGEFSTIFHDGGGMFRSEPLDVSLVYEAIASNPNIPLTLLPDVVSECPDVFLQNPLLPLLALEDPLLSCIHHLDLRILYEMHQFASDAMRVVIDAAYAERKRQYGYITGENEDGVIVTEERAFFPGAEGIRLTPDHTITSVGSRMLRRLLEGK